jgi:hypothetical protein
MYRYNIIKHLFVVMLARMCVCSAAGTAVATAGHGQTAAATAANTQVQLDLPTKPQGNQATRTLQQDVLSLAELQQVLQRMRNVPIATPAAILQLGHKGLEAHKLRNWHLLARKLSRPGADVTIVTFGGSLTAGYLKLDEGWRSSMEGSWVEQLVKWLKVGGRQFNHMYSKFDGGGL